MDTPQKMQEVVGTELIGTGISMNASMGEGTRLAGGAAGWDKKDKLGLAWAVNDAPTISQSIDKVPNKTELVANHLFEVVDSKFETKGNIYKGWHFAYYPFAYQEEVGQKTILINSPQEVNTATDEGWFKRMSQGFHVSAMHFLTKADLNLETYKLDKEFVMKNALSNFVVRTNPAEGSSFTTEGALKDYQITSVTLKTGRGVFATSAKLDPTRIHRYDNTKTLEANNELLVASFSSYDASDNYTGALIPLKKNGTEGRETSLTTEIKVEDCVVSGKNNDLVIFALPYTHKDGAVINKDVVAIEIEAGGGKFVINYATTSEKNKLALDALMAAYVKKTGKMTMSAPQTVLLDVELRNEDFVVTWDNIMNITDWNNKVQLANDLKIKEPVFTLGEGAKVVFDAENPVLVPTNGVTVNAYNESAYNGGLYINYDYTWTNEQKDALKMNTGVAVYVNPNCTLTVTGELTPHRLVNNGVIKAGPTSTVGRKNSGGGDLVNTDGRVIVEYGAYVYTDAGNRGTIAYVVTDADETSPRNIKVLTATSGTQKGYANVNTLIINENIDLNLSGKAGSSSTDTSDRYEDVTTGTDAVTYPDLANVDIEINGGSLSIDAGKTASVNNVTMNGGKLTNITVNGNLDVKGDVEVKTASVNGYVNAVGNDQAEPVITVTGDINGAEKAATGETLIANKAAVSANAIKGIVKAIDATITANEITGNVTAEGETTINNADMAALTVAEDADVDLNKVNVAGILTNNGTVALTNETAAKVGTLTNNGTLTSNVDINVTDVSLNPGSWTTLDSDAAVIGFDKVIWYTGTYFNEDMTLQGKVAQYGSAELIEALKDGGDVTLKGNVTLSEAVSLTKATNIDLNGYTLTTSTSEGTGDDITISAGAKLTVQGGKVETSQTAFFNNGGELTLTNCEIVANNSGATAVSSNGGKMNITGGSIKCLEDVQSDYYVVGYRNSAQGTINTTVEGKKMGALIVTQSASVTVSGGTYKAGRFYGLYVGGATANYNIANTEFIGAEAEKDICVDDTNYGASTINNAPVSGIQFYEDTVNN